MPRGRHTKRPKTKVRINNTLTIRDATLEDIEHLKPRVRYFTKKYFGDKDLMYRYRSAAYSLAIENEANKIVAYANIENQPNILPLPKGYWMDWLQFYYKLPKITYGNTLFLTFLMVDDTTNQMYLKEFYKEVFIREPKVKFICTVGPPVDSQYEDLFLDHCEQIYPLEESVSRLCQCLFVCDRYSIIPQMRLRRALAEDNDDLVEIIDEKLKVVRQTLGDFYISEQVLREDPTESIVVAEISNTTIGMIWINTNVHRKSLVENFETSAFGNFLKPKHGNKATDEKLVTDILRKPSFSFFSKSHAQSERDRRPSDDYRHSLNNLYEISSSSSGFSAESETRSRISLFAKWRQLASRLKGSHNYREVIQKNVKYPKVLEMCNVFAIKMFGLTQSIDPRRIFDLVSAAFAAYPDKDYCIMSLSSSEASSDSLCGPLLRYFSRMVPRPVCKISDCVYVTHKNCFLTEIEVNYMTPEDIPDIEKLLCTEYSQGTGIYYVADLSQHIKEYIYNPWSTIEILVMRSGGCPIGFALIEQNCEIPELLRHYVLIEEDDIFMDFEAGIIKYLHLHPAFTWEYMHVYREMFRLSGYYALHYKLIKEDNKPILNSLLSFMFPIFPRKRIWGPRANVYALYFQSMKLVHIKREQIENKIVIVGFNEACQGFLRTLLFSEVALRVQCINMTVITPYPGIVEAEHDVTSFEGKHLFFFKSKNQFDSDYLMRLELRTWVAFIGSEISSINTENKHIMMEDGSVVRYDKLFLMCSVRYNAPKIQQTYPVNLVTLNCKLDRILFYQQMKVLATEFVNDEFEPILIFGSRVIAHATVHLLMQIGISPSKICLVTSRMGGKIEFPETFDDKEITEFLFDMEKEAGVTIIRNLSFVDWKINAQEDVIESVIFESDFERILVKCSVFVCFHGVPISEHTRQALLSNNILMKDNRIVIDQNSQTCIPSIYACGRICQYDDALFAKNVDQAHFNQLEVGNKLALNFIENRLTGEPINMVTETFVKPLFRQNEVIGNMVYAALRKPGRYLPRDIRKKLRIYGHDIITRDKTGEYCRILLDHNGFITEIACITRKYQNLEFLYRIYGLHESLFNNLQHRCLCGQIENLLDFFNQDCFSLAVHDKFFCLKQSIRQRHLDAVNLFIKDKNRINKEEIMEFLREQNMTALMQKEVFEYIILHYRSLGEFYALPRDFH